MIENVINITLHNTIYQPFINHFPTIFQAFIWLRLVNSYKCQSWLQYIIMVGLYNTIFQPFTNHFWLKLRNHRISLSPAVPTMPSRRFLCAMCSGSSPSNAEPFGGGKWGATKTPIYGIFIINYMVFKHSSHRWFLVTITPNLCNSKSSIYRGFRWF